MASRKTPQQRSIEVLRAEGWWPEVCEQVNRWGRVTQRRDLLGFADLICFPVDSRNRDAVLLVQVTSASNHAARRAKIANEHRVGYARLGACAIEIHSWRKNSKGEWVLRREDLS